MPAIFVRPLFRTSLWGLLRKAMHPEKRARHEYVGKGSSLLCVGNGKIELSGNEVDDSDQISG